MSVPAAPGRNYKWWAVAMLWWISFFNYADRQAIFSVFPLLQSEMGLNNVQLGLLGSSFAWIYGLSAPFAGFIVDRVRRTTAILGGLHIWSIICVATASARTFPQLLFWRAAEGLGETFYFPASMSFLSDYHGKRTRSRALGIHQTSVYIGTIGGGFFAGLIGQHYGWRWSFIVFGSLGILLGFVLHKLLIEPQRGGAEPAAPAAVQVKALGLRDTLKVVFATPTLLLLFGAFLSANFVAVVLYSWMPKFLYDKFSLDLATAGLFATLFAQCAGMAGAPTGGWLADKLRMRHAGGRMRTQCLALFAAAPFVLLAGQTGSMPFLIASLIAWGFLKGVYDANIFASAYDVVPAPARGSVAGWMNLIGWLGGGGTAPLVIGIIAEYRGLSFAISSAALMYLLGGVLLATGILFTVRRDAARIEAGA